MGHKKKKRKKRRKRHIVLIMGAYHRDKVEVMRKAAREMADRLGLKIDAEIWVPGSYEVPLVLQRQLRKRRIDGAVLLGIIERGETAHGLVMAQSVMPLILALGLMFGKPVGMAILGPEIDPEQMDARLIPYAEKGVMAVA